MEQGVVVYLHVVGYDGTKSISLPDSPAISSLTTVSARSDAALE